MLEKDLTGFVGQRVSRFGEKEAGDTTPEEGGTGLPAREGGIRGNILAVCDRIRRYVSIP